MPFTLIVGTFHIMRKSPDGDSMRFKANRKTNWSKLSGPPVGLNSQNQAQLRFEAIDALETHYTVGPPAGRVHQPQALAFAATDAMLTMAGFEGVIWGPNHSRVTDVLHDGVAGYILSRAAERFRRPVAFVFAGAPPEDDADGSQVFLDANRMKQSINYEMLRVGHAYPTYYEGLFNDLRDAMTGAARSARKAKRGVWRDDKTTSGVIAKNLASITDQHPILPKLFRRLADYMNDHNQSVASFKTHLQSRPENVLQLSTQNFTHFDAFVDLTGKTVKLTVPPEDLVFRP